MKASKKLIIFDNVKMAYSRDSVALKGISFQIEDGEFVFITGPSGAGKSSIIHLLTCENFASEGKLIVAGTNLKSLSHRQIAKYRRKIGVVFQDFRLIPNMTVYDNVAFAVRVVGRGGKEVRERVETALDIVGLTHKIYDSPKELSGGEQQRVALARAIVNSPEIIIADEPTGNVDPVMSIEIMKLLSSINKNGITVVVVTHEQRLVKAFKKREIRLREGLIEFDTEADKHQILQVSEEEVDQNIPPRRRRANRTQSEEDSE